MSKSSLCSENINLVLSECQQMIRVGSKSFSLASQLFRPETRGAAFFLYGWCRYCDDQIDQAQGREEADFRLGELNQKTKNAFLNQQQSETVFIAFQQIVKQYQIPQDYPRDLLEGMAMDVRGQKYFTLEDLKVYCYRVAGTVGLMMVHVMGVSDEKALKHAVDLGIAMQLTNIARDIFEDFAMGRVYLPQSWLQEWNIPEDELTLPKHRVYLTQMVACLLNEAEKNYTSGRAGLDYLPFRSALAVSAAISVYSQIGHTVLKRGEHAWDTRTIVSKTQKCFAVVQGIFEVIGSIPRRWMKPWSPASIRTIWRPL
jgi:phytoene synthase